MLNHIVSRALASAGLPSILEPVGLMRSDVKRADGCTLIAWRQGASLAWDATAVDALAPSNITRSAQSPGSAASAEERKTAKYEELVQRGYIFQPVSYEVQGTRSGNRKVFTGAWEKAKERYPEQQGAFPAPAAAIDGDPDRQRRLGYGHYPSAQQT
jgi:hypothetical protein